MQHARITLVCLAIVLSASSCTSGEAPQDSAQSKQIKSFLRGLESDDPGVRLESISALRKMGPDARTRPQQNKKAATQVQVGESTDRAAGEDR